MTTVIRIDNCFVEKYSESGIRIGPLRIYEKEYKKKYNAKLVCDDMPYVSTGSKRTDSLLMQGLLSGSKRLDDVEIIYTTSCS